MTLNRSIALGKQRDTSARVPVRPGADFARSSANRAVVRAMDAAQRLTGLDTRQLDDEQRRLREERQARVEARVCICGGEVLARVGHHCARCGGRVVEAVQ